MGRLEELSPEERAVVEPGGASMLLRFGEKFIVGIDDTQRRDLIAALDDAVDTWGGDGSADLPPEPDRVDRWRELRRLLEVAS